MCVFLCRACYGVLRFIMESGAKGCEVVVSGKLRGQRAKSMKFVDGLMIHSGEPINDYVDTAVRHVLLRQGKSQVLKPRADTGLQEGSGPQLPKHNTLRSRCLIPAPSSFQGSHHGWD